ncbi:baeRF3 domain-containing protein [Chryseolinea lacunae]|uniref:Uncharacterized protein n=1 Tax=Chryseolinea lacunae TaxID=2801331 RepID=A0ABS1KNW6_9BACT|nr:hypothetical protein [Chryseolinea lacunae]MBL0741034.1 hypothetical protein [Chryseolinea lacunae]
MDTTDIDDLLAEKDTPCVSIVISTPRFTNPRTSNAVVVSKALQKARLLLTHSAWPRDKINRLEIRLDVVASKIDTIGLQKGLAIFISPAVFKIYLLPFSVKEKIMLGKSFELQEMIYYAQFLEPYYLLALSKKKIRLLKGSGQELQEVENADFPKHYQEEFEYEHPSIGTSFGNTLKAFEKDKSELQSIRLEAFVRKSDAALGKYLKKDTPLFIAGVSEEVSSFENLSHHKQQLTGVIKGNYDHDAVHPLADSVWNTILTSVKTRHHDWLRKLDESMGSHMGTAGIRNVWRAASEGNVFVLLLEKDYHVTAYSDAQNARQLYITPPLAQHHIVPNAASEVVRMVKEKGGQVVIVDNDMLQHYKHIAILLRYEETVEI